MKKTLDQISDEHFYKVAEIAFPNKKWVEIIRKESYIDLVCANRNEFTLYYDFELGYNDWLADDTFEFAALTVVEVCDYLRSLNYDIPNQHPSQPERVEGVKEGLPTFRGKATGSDDWVYGSLIIRSLLYGNKYSILVLAEDETEDKDEEVTVYFPSVEAGYYESEVWSPLPAAPSAVDWDEVEGRIGKIISDCQYYNTLANSPAQIVDYLKNTLTAKD